MNINDKIKELKLVEQRKFYNRLDEVIQDKKWFEKNNLEYPLKNIDKVKTVIYSEMYGKSFQEEIAKKQKELQSEILAMSGFRNFGR